MQYLTRWKPTLGIILTALFVCLCAVPNFFPEATVKGWPAWAQRRLVLGLDLQGGSYLLLEVDSNDVKKTRLNQIREDVQRTLRGARIQYTDLAVKGDAVEVRIRNATDQPNALSKLRDLSQPLGGLLGGTTPARSRCDRRRRQPDPADHTRTGDRRSPAQDHRAVDPDRREAASTSSAPSSR